MRTFEGNKIKILAPNKTIYEDETQTIIIEPKLGIVAKNIFVEINGIEFKFYETPDGRRIIYDYTDIVRSNQSGVINVRAYFVQNNYIDIFQIDWEKRKGISPTGYVLPPPQMRKLVTGDFMSLRLLNANFIMKALKAGAWEDVMMILSNRLYQINVKSEWQALRFEKLATAPSTFDETFDETFNSLFAQNNIYQINFITPECDREWLKIKWVSENGTYKTFLFAVLENVISWDSAVFFENYTDGYNYTKNRIINKTIILEKADIYTHLYVADIVTSKEVYIVEKNNALKKVFVADKTFKKPNYLTFKDTDIKLTLNINKYEL